MPEWSCRWKRWPWRRMTHWSIWRPLQLQDPSSLTWRICVFFDKVTHGKYVAAVFHQTVAVVSGQTVSVQCCTIMVWHHVATAACTVARTSSGDNGHSLDWMKWRESLENWAFLVCWQSNWSKLRFGPIGSHQWSVSVCHHISLTTVWLHRSHCHSQYSGGIFTNTYKELQKLWTSYFLCFLLSPLCWQ